jgi:hypothetical protein
MLASRQPALLALIHRAPGRHATFFFHERSLRQSATQQAGLLASGSVYWPRLPANDRSTLSKERHGGRSLQIEHHVAVAIAAVVPGYSGGTAADLHRFPYSFRSDKQPEHLVSGRLV